MIRFLKQRLSIAERANGDGRWAALLPGICKDYNNALVRGTDVRRRDVNQDNYLQLLEKLHRTTEPSLLFNMAETFRYPSGLSRFLWRYAVGDKVLLARRVDYDLRGRNYFEKPSVAGTYGPKVYTVTECRTKLNADLFLCPVYALSPLTGLFYESELSPALFDVPTAAAAAAATPPAARAAAAPIRRSRRTPLLTQSRPRAGASGDDDAPLPQQPSGSRPRESGKRPKRLSR